MHLFSRPIYSLRSKYIFPRNLTARFYVIHNHLRPSRLQSKTNSVTSSNDNENVSWTGLSRKEKFMRSTCQTFYLGLIFCGATLFGGVTYILYTEVFSLDSQTSYFNTAVDRIKKDSRCIAVLGDPDRIIAYGDLSTNNRRKSKPLVSTSITDEYGNKHLFMKFNVNGPKNKGIVYVQLVKKPSDIRYSYRYIGLRVDGKPMVFLDDTNTFLVEPSKKLKLFGVTWR